MSKEILYALMVDGRTLLEVREDGVDYDWTGLADFAGDLKIRDAEGPDYMLRCWAAALVAAQ